MPTRGRARALDRGTVLRFWVVVLAAVCVVVSSQAGPWQPAQLASAPFERVPAAQQSATADPVEREAVVEPSEVVEPGADLRWLRRVATIAVVAALLFLLVRWALRVRLPDRPPAVAPGGPAPPVPAPPADPDPDGATLQQGARTAQERLRADVSPSDAVIAAWVALEDAAARSGVVRAPSATPTEFTLQVLDRTPADPSAARTLLGLYLRARFDDRPLSAPDVATAAAAAQALVDTVHRGRGPGGPGAVEAVVPGGVPRGAPGGAPAGGVTRGRDDGVSGRGVVT